MANNRELALRPIVALTPEEEERDRAIERLPGTRDELLREIARTKDPATRRYLTEQLEFTPGDGGGSENLAEFDATTAKPTNYSNLVDVSGWEPIGGSKAGGKGVIDVSGWERFDYAPPAPEAEPKRMGTADRVAHSFSKGAASLVEGVGWLTGLDSVEKWGREQKDRIQATQLQDPELAAAFKKYEDSKGFLEAAKTLISTPPLLADFLVSSAAQMLPGIPAASISGTLGRIGFNLAKSAGAAEGVAAAVGRATAEKWAARFGASATEGIIEGSSTGAEAQQFLESKGWDPARARDAANEAALKVFAATTALSVFGTGRLEGDLATHQLKERGIKGAAKEIGAGGLEEMVQNTASEQFTTEAKQLADPTQQPDLGKAAASGLITGLGISAPLHAAGRMTEGPAPKPEPKPEPPPQATPINPVNADATLLALDKAQTVDEAIAVVSAAASRPLEFERGVSIQDMEKDLAIRSVMGSKALESFLEGLDQSNRDGTATVLRMAASKDGDFADGVRQKAIERAYDMLSQAGVLDAAEQERIASKLEGTPEDKQMIAEASALMSRDEWQAHREAQPEQLAAQLAAHETTVGNAQMPEAYRAEVAKVALDYAKRSGIAKAMAEGTMPTGRTSMEPVARTMPPEQILASTKLPVSHGRMEVVDPATLGKSAPTLFKKGKIGGGTARFLQVMGRAVGREVAFFKQSGHLTHVDGFSTPEHPDTIFLNAESSGAAAMNVVLGHEFFHSMPEPIKAGFLEAIKPLIDPSKHEALVAYINQPTLDNAQVMEEIGADLFGNRFNEPETITKFLDGMQDKSIAQKVFEFVRNFIDKMIQAVKGAGNFKTDDFVTDLEKVRGAWVTAMQQYMGEAEIGGKQAKDVTVENLARLATVKGLAGDRARAEIARRKKSGEDPGVYDSLLKAAQSSDPQAAMQLWLRDHRASQLTAKQGETKTNVKPEKVEPKIEVVEGSKTKDANVSKLKEELDRGMVKRRQDGERRSTYEDADAVARVDEAANGKRETPELAKNEPKIIAKDEPQKTPLQREVEAYREAKRKEVTGETMTPAERALARMPEPEGALPKIEVVQQKARKYAETGVVFEVAPAPDSAIFQTWNDLSASHRLAISQRVAQKIIPRILGAIGVDGGLRQQWGGYMGVTNPSFRIDMPKSVTPAQVELVAAATGFALNQESMMVVTPLNLPKAESVGLITIYLPENADAQLISDTYKKIYEIENGILQGHTTVGGKMSIVDFSGRTEELVKLIDLKLSQQFHVENHAINTRFIDRGEYENVLQDQSARDAAATGSSLRDNADSIRREAEDLIAEEFTARGIEPIRWSTERGADDRDGRSPLDEGRAGQNRFSSGRDLEAYRKAPARPEAVTVEGVHYSQQQRPFLLSDKYGTGIKGAEYNRVMSAADKRLRKRIYFYVNTSQGVFPEEGVGAFAHHRTFDNLYDADGDPLGLANKDKNAFESAILDAGFDGYYSHGAFGRQGAAVLIGDHIVDVQALPPGATTAVGPKPGSNPRNDLMREFLADQRNPFAQVDEARIKQFTPDLHERLANTGVFDRLKPGEKYYKDEIAALIPRDAKFSTERGDNEAQFAVVRNLGDLDAAQQAAAERVLGKPKTIKEQFEAFRTDWKKNLIQGVFDQFAPLKELSTKAYVLARMSRGGDSTLEALLLYGKVFVDQDGFYDVQYTQANGPAGFAQAMAKLNGEQDRFLLWVAAQRAEQLKAVGLENLFSEDDIRDLKTLGTGAMKDGTPRAALYAQGLADLKEFNASVLQIAADSGLIDDATRRMYENTPYVPFYRLQEEGITGFSLSPGLVNQTAWKKLKGGTDKLNADLMANMLKNWSHLITASAKNRAAKASLEAAVAQGVATEVPNGTPGKGLVSFRENGKERTFLVEDEHVMDAITSLETASLGAWAKPFIAMKRMLTVGVTASPTFKLRNLLRDSISAIGTADLDYNPIANLSKGWKLTDKASEVRAKMLASGGMIRFGSMLDGNSADHARRLIEKGVDPDSILDASNKIEKFWKTKLHPAIEAYQELGDRGEQVNRAALYQRLLDKGLSHGEASFWARDLMDFSSSGKWAAVRMLTQTVPFMNARLQGLYKLGRAGKDDAKRMGTVLGAVSLASIGLMLAHQDDEDFKKREDWDRQTYWWFKVGDTAFRIPKPFEIGAAGTIAEFGVELFSSDQMTGKRFLSNLGQIVGNQLNMNPVPQLVKPLLDSYANQDSFTRRPIENLAQQRLRPEDRYGANTSEMARFLGSLGLPDPLMLAQGHYDPLSPVKVDQLTKGYFGWLGTMLTTALDYGIRPALNRGEKPEMKLRDVFLVGNFVESLPSNSSRHLTVLYEQAKEIEQAYASYQKALKSGDVDAARALLKEEGDKIAKYKGVEKVKREESRLNQLIQQTMDSKTLSAETKRKMIDQFSQQRDRLAESAGLK